MRNEAKGIFAHQDVLKNKNQIGEMDGLSLYADVYPIKFYYVLEFRRLNEMDKNTKQNLLIFIAGIITYFIISSIYHHDKMNSILLQLLPLITIFIMLIIIFAAIKIKVSSNTNGNSSQANSEYRRLFKSKSNRVIAGVCGGIAEYFGWNATFVRLFFLFSGVGLFAYIILSIVLPDSDSPLL